MPRSVQKPSSSSLLTEARVWMVRAGRQGEDEATALDEGLAIIGFSDIPSLDEATAGGIVELVSRENPGAPERRILNRARQLTAFALSMQEGDIVVLPLKTSGQIALGRVDGAYRYRKVNGALRHTRAVRWTRTDVPRSSFQQDLLYSMGAFMTVCRISRNQAGARFLAVLNGGTDPGPGKDDGDQNVKPVEAMEELAESQAPFDVVRTAHDQIQAYIAANFAQHDFADLIDAILRAEGYATDVSIPGPDGGVDILAARGPLGFEGPYLCVQVKSSKKREDVTTLRALQGTMQNFKASHGLLVAWGGFTRAVHREARQSFFQVRLWDANTVVETLYRIYERLPEEIQAKIPLRQVWTLVLEQTED